MNGCSSLRDALARLFDKKFREREEVNEFFRSWRMLAVDRELDELHHVRMIGETPKDSAKGSGE